MFKQVRKKFVSSITNVETPDQFEWGKWLRPPLNDYYLLNKITADLIDTNGIDLFIPPPSNKNEVIKLPKVKLYKSSKKTEFPKSRISIVFFGLGKVESKEIKFINPNKNDFSFSLKLIRKDNELFYKIKKKGHDEKLVKISVQKLTPNFKPNTASAKEIAVKLKEPLQKSHLSKIKEPAITDHLSTLKPEVIKIDLLELEIFNPDRSRKKNIEVDLDLLQKPPEIFQKKILNAAELVGQLNKTDAHKKNRQVLFDVLVKLPKTYKVKILNLNNVKVPTYFLKNIQVNNVKMLKRIFSPIGHSHISEQKIHLAQTSHDLPGIKKISIHEELSKTENKVTNFEALDDRIKLVLHPSVSFDEKELSTIFKSLYNYQKEGAEFLAGHNHVILSDELGLGKTVQSIAALKLLFRKGEIRSALIVSRNSEIGNGNLSNKTGSSIGWTGHFNNWASELSYTVIEENSDESSLKWKKSSLVHITSYDTLFNDLEKNIIDKERIKKFDCVIFDEAQNLINNYFGLGNIFSSGAKYLWALTSLPADTIDLDLRSILNSASPGISFQGTLKRTKEKLFNELPSVVRQNYWLDLDDEQKKEFDEALKNGQKQLSEFLDKGNPYRFQANTFFLIHQLNQICNFSAKKEISKKSDLLLRHLDIITRNEQKVLVFSQYDKFGTQRIEQLLQKNNIRYVRYIGGMSASAMETAIKSFRSNKKVTVFLASLKAAGVKYNLAEVPYLIHFDQWWNPISHWQAEERVNNPDKDGFELNQNLNVYNYLMKNSVDEKIRAILNEKGLLNKNLVETLSAETIYSLISMEEWLNILDIPKKEEIFNKEEVFDSAVNKISKLNYEEFGDKIKNLLNRLGYKNLTVQQDHNKEEINIYGTVLKNGSEIKIAAKCISSDFVSKESVSGFITASEKHNDKIFIFTKGSFEDEVNVNEKVSLISGNSSVNYLITFQC